MIPHFCSMRETEKLIQDSLQNLMKNKPEWDKLGIVSFEKILSSKIKN